MYERIMLTSDGSVLAHEALAHASAIAAATNATVVLLAAVDSLDELRAEGQPTGWLDLGGELTTEQLEAADQRQRATAREHLAALSTTLIDAGVRATEEHVVTGPAGPAIVGAADELDCSLIVMATHGRSGLGRALLGSVADHVVHHAKCPVLLVRPESP